MRTLPLRSCFLFAPWRNVGAARCNPVAACADATNAARRTGHPHRVAPPRHGATPPDWLVKAAAGGGDAGTQAARAARAAAAANSLSHSILCSSEPDRTSDRAPPAPISLSLSICGWRRGWCFAGGVPPRLLYKHGEKKKKKKKEKKRP